MPNRYDKILSKQKHRVCSQESLHHVFDVIEMVQLLKKAAAETLQNVTRNHPKNSKRYLNAKSQRAPLPSDQDENSLVETILCATGCSLPIERNNIKIISKELFRVICNKHDKQLTTMLPENVKRSKAEMSGAILEELIQKPPCRTSHQKA
ncbi:hypothetical protein Trydic_g12212 [Trypoxylus dichotomus]